MRQSTLPAVLMLVGPLLLGLGSRVATCAPEDAARARQRFLADGNASALAAALAGEASDLAKAEAALARLAADPRTAPPEAGGHGVAAVLDAVAALRRLDLGGAEAAASRIEKADGAPADAWGGTAPFLRALVLARRGEDEAAARVCLEAKVSREPEALYRLALLGAALPEEDRLLLLATVRAAALEAAVRGRHDVLAALAEGALALDRASGIDALILAARSLRRAGDAKAAQACLAGPGAARAAASNAPAVGALACERAIDALLAGDRVRSAAALAGVRSAPHEQSLVTALARGPLLSAGRLRGPAVGLATPDERREAWFVARVAGYLGRPAEVHDLPPVPAGSGATRLAAALAARGLSVLPLAGDPAALDRVLDRGLPALMLVPALRGEVWRELPVLVVGRARAEGLWLLDEPDPTRSEVVGADFLAKGRLLVALPDARQGERAALRGAPEAEELGRALEDAAAAREAGDVDGALRRLRAHPHPSAIRDAAIALTLQGRASAAGDRMDAADVREAAEAAERALATPPPTPFELHLRGQGRALARDVEGALAAFADAERAGGPAAWLDRSRFALLTATRHRHADALRAVDAAWRLDPLQEIALYYRGAARRSVGDSEGARADMRRALDRRPGTRAVALDLAILELEARRPRAALEVLDDLTRLDPGAGSLASVRDARRAAERALLHDAPTVAELAPFRGSPEPDTRRWLAFALAEHETPESEALLRSLLEDPAAPVRVTALRVYMRPWFRAKVEGDASLSEHVVAMLTSDPDPLVRGAAAALLSLVPRPFAEESLAARLTGPSRDADPYPRSASAAALARHAGALSREALVAGLEDEDATVRRSAIEALFRIASTYNGFDPDASPPLRAPAVVRWRAWLSEPSGG